MRRASDAAVNHSIEGAGLAGEVEAQVHRVQVLEGADGYQPDRPHRHLQRPVKWLRKMRRLKGSVYDLSFQICTVKRYFKCFLLSWLETLLAPDGPAVH